jgi:Cu-processing system permease protein
MWQQLWQHALIACRSGWRGHSFRAIFICGCLLVGAAYVAASFSGRQPMTVGLDVGLSGIRLIVTLMALFWVQDLVAKDIDRKNLLWILAFPAPRSFYVLGRFLGIATLVLLAVLILGCLLYAVVRWTGLGYTPLSRLDLGWAYWLTLLYIALDVWVVSAVAILIAMLSTSAVMPLLVGAGFAIASRSLGGVIAYLLSGDSNMSVLARQTVQNIQWLVPDLSRLDIRDITLYSVKIPEDILWSSTLMALSYLGIALLLACVALTRREVA